MGGYVNTQDEEFTGNNRANSIFGLMQTGERLIEAQSNFIYTLAPDDYVIPTSNSGTTGVVNAKGFVDSNTTTGTTEVSDRNRIRYRPGTESGLLFTAAFVDTDPDATARVGMFDDNDGIYIGHDGSDYIVGKRRSTGDVTIPRSEWDNPLDEIDFSGLNVFRISFGYLGAAPITYDVLTKGGWETLHRLRFFGDALPNITNPNLVPKMSVETTSNVDARVESGSWVGYTMATPERDPQQRPFTKRGIRDSGLSSATNEHVLTIRVKETYQGKTNVIPISFRRFDALGQSSDRIDFEVTRNASFGSALSYTDIDTENSVVEFSTDATTVTPGDKTIQLASVPSGGTGNKATTGQTQTGTLAQPLKPGQTASVYATSASVPVYLVGILSWSELF